MAAPPTSALTAKIEASSHITFGVPATAYWHSVEPLPGTVDEPVRSVIMTHCSDQVTGGRTRSGDRYKARPSRYCAFAMQPATGVLYKQVLRRIR
ncbi:hypothetical protein AB1E33_11970 [Ruegeria sp. 2012CJ15-1]